MMRSSRNFFDEIRYVDHLESVDAIREHMVQIRESHSISALLAPGENAIEIGGQLRSEFGIPGMQRNQAEAVRNKWIMKQMLHNAEFGHPKLQLLYMNRTIFVSLLYTGSRLL